MSFFKSSYACHSTPAVSSSSLNSLPNRLTRGLLSAALVVIVAGCTNNAADATGNANVVKSSQATTSQKAANSDTAVVKALQENLKASGIEERIVSAEATAMDGILFKDKLLLSVMAHRLMSVVHWSPVRLSKP